MGIFGYLYFVVVVVVLACFHVANVIAAAVPNLMLLEFYMYAIVVVLLMFIRLNLPCSCCSCVMVCSETVFRLS